MFDGPALGCWRREGSCACDAKRASDLGAPAAPVVRVPPRGRATVEEGSRFEVHKQAGRTIPLRFPDRIAKVWSGKALTDLGQSLAHGRDGRAVIFRSEDRAPRHKGVGARA